MPSVAISAARPSSGKLGALLGRVLRRALRHERVLLRDEDAVPELTLDRHLTIGPELIGNRSLVEDGDRLLRGAVAVTDPEAKPAAVGVALVARLNVTDER